MENKAVVKTEGSASPRSRGQATSRYVLEHQGPTRIVHQADGSITCEPLNVRRPSSTRSSSSDSRASHKMALRNHLLEGALVAASITGGLGAFLGFSVALISSTDSLCTTPSKGTKQEVVAAVSNVVQQVVVGTMAGAVVAPATVVFGGLFAAATVVRMALRPALLGLAVHQSVRWVRRHQLGAAALIRKLQSGDLVKQLEALRRLVARLSTNLAFTSQFKRLSGIEVLLSLLERALALAEEGAAALAGTTASLTTRALAELAKQGDVADALVDLDAVPLLLRAASVGLRAATPTTMSAGVAATHTEAQQGGGALLVHAMTALARITAHHAVAQQVLAAQPGVCGVVVAALEAATSRSLRSTTPAACDELRGHAVTLMQALALEPAAKAELGGAGGVEALSAAFVTSVPLSQGQATAAAALHALVRGDPDNQRRLALVAPAGLSAAINRALLAHSIGSTGCKVGSQLEAAGGAGSGASSLMAAAGPLAGPIAPQDLHVHRADLVALINIITRYAAPPSPTKAAAVAAASTPALTITTFKPAAATAAPKQTLFRRFGFTRSARHAPMPGAAAPAPSLESKASGEAAKQLPGGQDVAAPASGTPAMGQPQVAHGEAVQADKHSPTPNEQLPAAAGVPLPDAAVWGVAAAAAARLAKASTSNDGTMDTAREADQAGAGPVGAAGEVKGSSSQAGAATPVRDGEESASSAADLEEWEHDLGSPHKQATAEEPQPELASA